MSKVICQICGKESSRLYGAHLKSHGITSEEYKKKFPNFPLCSDEDNKNTSKSSGLHMKDEKYRKMFAEKIKGDKNPNAKSKTTEEQRKQRSPFSKNFIKYENENQALEFSRKVNGSISDEKRVTKIEYYINKGLSIDEAKLALKKRQCTFNLEKCLDKYGEVGLEVWNNRQKLWSEKIEKKYKNGDFHKFRKDMTSSPENELFKDIVNTLGIQDKAHYGKNQIIRKFSNGKIYSYDFMYKNKIIEFNGDYWHCNPKRYKEDYLHLYLQMTAKEIWDRDEVKKKLTVNEGYDYLVIWENDFKTNKEKVVKECINFLIN